MNDKPVLIAPSILAADFMNLAAEVKNVEQAGADIIHCDVMDGHFVPNLTFGPPLIEQLKAVATIPLDVHLMIEKPEKWIEKYIQAGAAWLTIHFEATFDCASILKEIRKLGAKPGISIKPGTPVEQIEDLVPLCHHILVMTVEPGFGGQKFRPECLKKVTKLTQWIAKKNLSTVVEVDGGINRATIAEARKAGASVFVAGTEVFSAENYATRVQELRTAARGS